MKNIYVKSQCAPGVAQPVQHSTHSILGSRKEKHHIKKMIVCIAAMCLGVIALRELTRITPTEEPPLVNTAICIKLTPTSQAASQCKHKAERDDECGCIWGLRIWGGWAYWSGGYMVEYETLGHV